MAIAFVKATQIEATTGKNASGTVIGTAGNLWVALASKKGASQVPTPSGGGTWTVDASVTETAAVIVTVSMSSAPNITGGSQTVTISTGTSGAMVTMVHEYTNAVTASPVDTTPTTLTNSNNAPATNSLSNTQADAVFVAVVGMTTSNAADTLTGSGSGWTFNPNSTDESNGSSFVAAASGYKVVSSLTTESSSWSAAVGSGWATIIGSYRGTGTTFKFQAAWARQKPVAGSGVF